MFEIELFRKLSNISQLGKNPRGMIQIGFETEFFSVRLGALVITKSKLLRCNQQQLQQQKYRHS